MRLLETRPYEWAVVGEGFDHLDVLSTLTDARKQRWLVRRRKGDAVQGRFTVINHLGYASFSLVAGEDAEAESELLLEFVSKKIDFDTEYRKMTEDIAGFCEQLLLTWEAPTGLKFSSDQARPAALLLERFLFLRSFLTTEKLSRLLEVIARKPHSKLVSHREWKPAGMARSTEFLTDPGGMIRSWRRSNDGCSVPGEVLDVRKEDTHDTAPNRFVKFALGQFRQLCMEVAELKEGNSPVGDEALVMMDGLDSVLGRRFFQEIGRLNRLPLDNQTLQKGEGYREILHAWILTVAAATLNWRGQEESFQGSTRDVATLYEYWIFLKLHKMLEDFPGMEILSAKMDNEDPNDFISSNCGEITIHLQSGEASRSRFRLKVTEEEFLNIDLHYERTFASGGDATSGRSYSRYFRPDYTLSMYPSRFDSESKAERLGKVAHLHFDAKYRVSTVAGLFGNDGEEGLEDEKKSEKSVSTYQRGDLLKMHTYNDALRQTIGSYILYPGNDSGQEPMRKFHEIAPGVGALVMKPGNDDCLEALEGFLSDIFRHQASQFTQYRYLADTRHKAVGKQPETFEEDGVYYNVARSDAKCVLMWLKSDTSEIFKTHGFAYCHAVPKNESKRLDLDLSTEIGSEFIPCGGSQGKELMGLGWRGKVTGARFLSKEKLHAYIAEKNLGDKLRPGTVDHYLLFEFDDVTKMKVLDVAKAHSKYKSGSQYMAVTCRWSDLLPG